MKTKTIWVEHSIDGEVWVVDEVTRDGPTPYHGDEDVGYYPGLKIAHWIHGVENWSRAAHLISEVPKAPGELSKKFNQETCMSQTESHPLTLEEKMNEWFTYHSPTPEQLPKYQAIREGAKAFAAIIVANTPNCADQTVAIRKIREAAMVGNQAIACNGV